MNKKNWTLNQYLPIPTNVITVQISKHKLYLIIYVKDVCKGANYFIRTFPLVVKLTILLSSAEASEIRSLSLLSTTKIKPCVFVK